MIVFKLYKNVINLLFKQKSYFGSFEVFYFVFVIITYEGKIYNL